MTSADSPPGPRREDADAEGAASVRGVLSALRAVLEPGARVFVVAATDAVARRAPLWAEAFAAGGWSHRVRIVEPVHDAAPAARAEIVAESRQFAAGVIAAEDGGGVDAVAREVAVAAGLPLVSLPRGTP